MPLTSFQAAIGRLLAENRDEESYLAGGAAILLQPGTQRISQDIDFFQDSAARVGKAFDADKAALEKAGYRVKIELQLATYIQAQVSKGGETTKVDWAQDSQWRFLPPRKDPDFGYVLQAVDLATNKVLALAGRDEPRDLVDTLFFHENQLPLGILVWAAPAKDPGFSPGSLLEMLKRRKMPRPEELTELPGMENADPVALKGRWMAALESAQAFIKSRPPAEAGCLYYLKAHNEFVDPNLPGCESAVPHFASRGGILPKVG